MVFELDAELPPGEYILNLPLGVPTEPTRPYDEIHAKFVRGSLAESTLLAEYAIPAQRDLPRYLYPTSPYLVEPGGTAVFGAAFANGGDPVHVTELVFEIPGGYDRLHPSGAPIFDDSVEIESLDGHPGTYSFDGPKRIVWTATGEGVEVGGTEPATNFWAFEAHISDDPAAVTSVHPSYDEGPVSTLTFPNGYTHTSRRWGPTPGVIRHIVPPASDLTGLGQLGEGDDGYPWSLLEETEYTIQGELVAEGYHETASATYVTRPQSGDAVDMESALAASSFRSESRLVPAGSTAAFVADLGALTVEASAEGLTASEFDVDLYSPNTEGCSPIASWSRDISTIPRAAVRDLQLWDASHTGVAPTLLLTGDDARVYQLDPSGNVVWSANVGAAGLVLRVVEPESGTALVVVGDNAGRVHRLDALTGSVVEAHDGSTAPWAAVATTRSITAIAVDAERERFAVANAGGGIDIFPFSGAATSTYLTETPGEHYVQLSFDDDGVLYGLTNNDDMDRLAFDAGGDAERTRSPWTGTGFTVSDERVFLTNSIRTRVLSAATLEGSDLLEHGKAILTASGHVTSDNVVDHVIATDDGVVLVVDGALATAAWQEAVQAPVEAPAPSALDPFLQDGRHVTCTQSGDGGVYDRDVACERTEGVENGDFIEGLDVADGRIAVAHRHEGVPVVTVYDQDGTVGSFSPASASTTLVRLGAWTGGGAALASANDGTVRVHTLSPFLGVFSSEVTQFIGRFTFAYPVPDAALFGMHLVVGTLRWEDATGVEYAAHLLDVIEVVPPDGIPPRSPAYVLHFAVTEGSEPLIDR